MFASNGINSVARAAPLIRKTDEFADVGKREAEITCSANETQAVSLFNGVRTVVAAGSRRRRKKANALIIPDGFHTGIGRLGEIADAQLRLRHGI